MKLTERSCEEFLEELASKAPVPGGGGAAAYVGALGAALCSMVCHFTIGKKKYAQAEPDVRAILEQVTVLRGKLLSLVEQDAEAFEPLSEAYKIPADDPGRAQVLERATLDACRAPAEMVRCCAEAIELLEQIRIKGSVMLVSDAGCGAILCHAAMKAAAMNVFINTRSLRDREAAERIEAEIGSLMEKYLPMAQKTADCVMEQIRS